MKLLPVLVASASVCSAISVPSWSDLVDTVQNQQPFASPEKYLVELSETETRWVTEEEKWQLLREGKKFFDITEHSSDLELALPIAAKAVKSVKYPKKTAYNDTVSKLLGDLDQKNMRKHLETFTSFHTRYYKSDYGKFLKDARLVERSESMSLIVTDNCLPAR
jgi:leucyl aminopeptidase